MRRHEAVNKVHLRAVVSGSRDLLIGGREAWSRIARRQPSKRRAPAWPFRRPTQARAGGDLTATGRGRSFLRSLGLGCAEIVGAALGSEFLSGAGRLGGGKGRPRSSSLEERIDRIGEWIGERNALVDQQALRQRKAATYWIRATNQVNKGAPVGVEWLGSCTWRSENFPGRAIQRSAWRLCCVPPGICRRRKTVEWRLCYSSLT